tara:strand:+ start:4319 stop:4708 length:390 start_codon:yes stop_codon:yes gene_type:complete
MNMAEKAKKILPPFIFTEWVLGILKVSDKWKDPVTGIRDSIYYMGDNGLSKTLKTPEGNVGVIISKPKPGEVEPPTIMVQIPNGRAIIGTCPEQMMIHKSTLALMSLDDFQKLSTKVSSALTEGVGATA